MAYSIKIVNKNNLTMLFQEAECKSASYRMNSKLLKQTLPDAPPEDAIVINLGRERNVPFPFLLRKTTADAADGTHTSPVKTVQEKVDYLLDVFITNGLEDLYTIDIVASAATRIGIISIVDSFNLDFTSEKPNTLPGDFNMSVGGAQQ